MSKSIIITEQQVLTCFLNKPELIDDENKCYFLNDVSIKIFNSLKKIRTEKGDYLTNTVVAYCNDTDIDAELIEDLKTKVQYSLDSYAYYHKRLVQEFIKANLVTHTLKMATQGLVANGDLDESVLDKLIFEVEKAKSELQPKSSILNFSTLLNNYDKNLKNLGSGIHFVPTGCHYLDSHLYGNGFEIGQVSSIFGNSGNGKSIFAEKLINGKINKQEPLLYIPTEMGQYSTMDRLLAMRTGLPIKAFSSVDEETKEIPDYVYEEFLAEKRRLSRNKNFGLIDQAGLSINDIKLLGNDMKKNLDIDYLPIFIDLGSMIKDFNGDNKASKYEDAMNNLFYMAKECNFAIIAIFQTRRKDNVNVQDYEDCKKFYPSINELKNSGAIEERSRVVISVFRQKYYGIRLLGEKDPEVLLADDIMQVAIQKQNNGPLSEIKYLYEGECGRLSYYEEDNEYEQMQT